MDELFEIVTKIIASPHNVITEHDKRRAIQVFLGFDDYLIDALPGYCEEGCEIDFGAYAANIIDELEGKLLKKQKSGLLLVLFFWELLCCLLSL